MCECRCAHILITGKCYLIYVLTIDARQSWSGLFSWLFCTLTSDNKPNKSTFTFNHINYTNYINHHIRTNNVRAQSISNFTHTLTPTHPTCYTWFASIDWKTYIKLNYIMYFFPAIFIPFLFIFVSELVVYFFTEIFILLVERRKIKCDSRHSFTWFFINGIEFSIFYPVRIFIYLFSCSSSSTWTRATTEFTVNQNENPLHKTKL